MAMDDLFSGSKNPASCSMRNAGKPLPFPKHKTGLYTSFREKANITIAPAAKPYAYDKAQQSVVK